MNSNDQGTTQGMNQQSSESGRAASFPVPEERRCHGRERDSVGILVMDDLKNPTRPALAMVLLPLSDEWVDANDPSLDDFPEIREEALERKRMWDESRSRARAMREERERLAQGGE